MALPTELSRIRTRLKGKAAHLRSAGENQLLAELRIVERAIDENEQLAHKVLSATAEMKSAKASSADEHCSCCGR